MLRKRLVLPELPKNGESLSGFEDERRPRVFEMFGKGKSKRLQARIRSGPVITLAISIILLAVGNLFAVTLKEIKTFTGMGAPKAVEVTPDGRYVLSINLEGMNVVIIDAHKFEKIKTVNFAPFRTAAQGHNYRTHKSIPSFAEKPVECGFSPDGRYAWISFHNGRAVVRYDFQEEEVASAIGIQKARIENFENREKYVYKLPEIRVGNTPKVVKVTPDGKYVLVSNWFSRSVTIIDARELKPVKEIKTGPLTIPRGIAISSDSRLAYVVNMRGGTISTIDLKNLTLINNQWVTPNPRHIVISSDDRFLFLTDNALGKVLRYDIANRKVAQSVVIGRQARTLELTPDEKYIIAASHGTNELIILETATLRILNRVKFFRPMGVSISPDGKTVWASSYGGGKITAFELKE